MPASTMDPSMRASWTSFATSLRGQYWANDDGHALGRRWQQPRLGWFPRPSPADGRGYAGKEGAGGVTWLHTKPAWDHHSRRRAPGFETYRGASGHSRGRRRGI